MFHQKNLINIEVKSSWIIFKLYFFDACKVLKANATANQIKRLFHCPKKLPNCCIGKKTANGIINEVANMGQFLFNFLPLKHVIIIENIMQDPKNKPIIPVSANN